MAFRDCSDLRAHHGQLVKTLSGEEEGEAARVVRIDNSCPRCGWFAAERKSWPKWDGVIHEDILPNQWEASNAAAREWLPKVAKAKQEAAEADEAREAAEEARRKAEADAAAERSARLAAEDEEMRVRASIATSERASAE